MGQSRGCGGLMEKNIWRKPYLALQATIRIVHSKMRKCVGMQGFKFKEATTKDLPQWKAHGPQCGQRAASELPASPAMIFGEPNPGAEALCH